MLHSSLVTKQCTVKWPHIAKVIYRIAQSYGEQSCFCTY